MKAGRLSYTVDGAGQRRIDTSELDRVFGVKTPQQGVLPPVNGASGASACEALQSNGAHAGEHAALERLLADREASIADLRQRLDASEAERRQLSERLHGLLTNQRDVGRGEKTVRRDSANSEREPANASENNTIDTSVSANAEPAADPIAAAERERELQAAPSARAGLAIPRPPWWRRWFR
jgi:TolA-binding protein